MNIKRRLTAIGLICSLMVLIFGGRSPTTVYADAIDHTHIWATKYDDKNHWEYCTVCGAIQNKEPHTLVGNRHSMAQCSIYRGNDTLYRKTCKCGYQSMPFIIFHGRWENFKQSRAINYSSLNSSKIDDYLQISKQEFNDHLSELNKLSCVSGGQKLDWVDDDGDGYGWVFCGGPIVKSNGIKGSLELIIGSEGDYGRKSSFDENYALVRYFNSTSSPTRQGFVNWLKTLINKSSNPTKHLLYGYDDKYQNNVTDEQFNKIIAEYKGYTVHPSIYGWGNMTIQGNYHQAAGWGIYWSEHNKQGECYDSSNNHYASYTDGIKTDCDICGIHCSGNEGYENDAYSSCSVYKGISEGQVVKCQGHNVYGREYMGTVYETFTKKNGEYYRVKVEAVPANGYTATINNCDMNFKIPRNYQHGNSTFSYYGTVRFSNGTTGRTIQCGLYNPFIDEDAPVINTITMTPQTSSNGWATISQLDVSGTENYCNMVYLTITNKSSGKVMLDNATVQVADKKYSYTATPPLEGSEGGTVYTASVKDLYGNVSIKDFTVYKTDGTAPQVESKLSYTDWTNTAKTITLTFTDYGSGSIQASLNDQTHYQACTKTTDGKYQVTYTFSDDITGTKNYTVYVKDALGNATGYTLTIGNIDKNTYNINYNLDGGSMSGQPTSYNVESSTFTLPTPTKTGYTFTGWTGSNDSTAQKTVTVNKGTRGNLSYTANWSANNYYVTFNGNGGSLNVMDGSIAKNNNGTATAKVQYDANNYCILGIMLTRQGYTFKGFYDAPSGGIQVFKPYDTANCLSVASKYYNENNMWKYTGNVTLYAQWTPNVYTNSIRHWTWGYKNQEGTNGNKEAYPLKTATFQSQYESTFVLDSAKAVNIPNGFCLRNFSTAAIIDGVWKDYLLGTKVQQKASNMYFEYNYDPISYSITYNLNGGTNSSTNPSTYDVLYAVSLKAPTKAGYTFTGWYDENGNKITGINEGCNAKFSSADDLYAKLAKRTTGNRVLTAHWSYNPISVKVPQMLIGDHTGKSQFRVKCDDFKAGNIKISVPNSFLYKQTGKADITATITSKSGNNTITPTNKVCIYDITANGLSAGCWQGSFNIGLTLTKE